MGTINLFRNAVKNPITTVVLVVVTIVMAVVIYGNIHDMHAATTGYDYCQSLCYLFENICVCLFYALGVSVIVKFFIAGLLFNYVYHHVESEYMDKLPSLARTVFSGAIYWIAIVFFLVPKFIKDTMKLKEEQELTV